MRRFVALVLCLGLAGCGGIKTYPVNGTVIYAESNQPAKDLVGYSVTLEPENPAEDGKKHSAIGLIGQDGSFTVSTFAQGDGALGGKHKVAITPPVPSGDVVIKSILPARFADLQQSGLIISVESGKAEVKLTVSKK